MRKRSNSSCAAIVLVIAVGAFTQNQLAAREKAGLPDAVARQPIDSVESGIESSDHGSRLAGRNEKGAGARQETNGVDHKVMMDRREDFLILLLQIFRSPK